jgi:hypothetical protein
MKDLKELFTWRFFDAEEFSVADPDPRVFGPPGSGSIISKNSKINFIFEK